MTAALILDESLELDDVWTVAVDGTQVEVSNAAADRMAAAAALLEQCIHERRRIYGVTTGYGPQAGYDVGPQHAGQLQRHLLYHLATGVGSPLPRPQTRAMMLARAANLARGYSGIGRPMFDLLLACLNRGVLPVVPEIGTVGASGDLTPLAHVGLLLIGEGEATFGNERLPALAALARAGLHAIDVGPKDGLALVNGTAAMTGIAALNGAAAQRAFHLALRFGAIYAECFEARGEAFDPRFGRVRPHPGQQHAHRLLALWLAGNERVTPSSQPPPPLDTVAAMAGVERELPQDPYSLRCLPQVFGAAFDVLAFHNRTVTVELNSATDNPLIFVQDRAVLHGGNFYGQHVGSASDTLVLAAINVAVHAERAIARLTDPLQNHGLPAFLHSAPSGINSGFMGAQVTASALVAELRSLALPASIQSIPTNANNQDVVPMGTIAARKAARCIELLWALLAIEAVILAQAVELLDARHTGKRFSSDTHELVAWIRLLSPALDDDRPLSSEIAAVARALPRLDLRIADGIEFV